MALISGESIRFFSVRLDMPIFRASRTDGINSWPSVICAPREFRANCRLKCRFILPRQILRYRSDPWTTFPTVYVIFLSLAAMWTRVTTPLWVGDVYLANQVAEAMNFSIDGGLFDNPLRAVLVFQHRTGRGVFEPYNAICGIVRILDR